MPLLPGCVAGSLPAMTDARFPPMPTEGDAVGRRRL
jgi:hypothetical protein